MRAVESSEAQKAASPVVTAEEGEETTEAVKVAMWVAMMAAAVEAAGWARMAVGTVAGVALEAVRGAVAAARAEAAVCRNAHPRAPLPTPSALPRWWPTRRL